MLWEGEGLMVSPFLEQYQTMEVYDPKLRQWEMLTGEFVEKRAVMNAVVVNDVVYIIGGQAFTGEIDSSLIQPTLLNFRWFLPRIFI